MNRSFPSKKFSSVQVRMQLLSLLTPQLYTCFLLVGYCILPMRLPQQIPSRPPVLLLRIQLLASPLPDLHPMQLKEFRVLLQLERIPATYSLPLLRLPPTLRVLPSLEGIPASFPLLLHHFPLALQLFRVLLGLDRIPASLFKCIPAKNLLITTESNLLPFSPLVLLHLTQFSLLLIK